MIPTKTNNKKLGLLLGIIVPMIVLSLVYAIRFNTVSFSEFVNLLNRKAIFTQILSLCVLPNLLVFFGFIWTNKLLSARGVLIATFIITVIILILKLVLKIYM